MTFTVVLLGTDTKYTPKPDPSQRSYFGETLSFVAAHIAQQTEVTIHPEKKIGEGEKVLVVEGPDTLGYGVGDRIARAVLGILAALARGEKNIKIIAHSRGAVEAILVAHELERIQQLLTQSNKPTHTDLIDSIDNKNRWSSVNYSTHFAMNTTLKNEFIILYQRLNGETLSKFNAGLRQIQLDIFNIDPVPGGNSALGHLVSTRWVDDRFYTIPSIVKNYEQCVYRHENSRSFKPIIPKATSEQTKVNLFDLPGHHGSGSGNIYDHDETVPTRKKLGEPEDARLKTGHVQELLLVKIVGFLQEGSQPVVFKTRDQVSPELDKKLIELIYDQSPTILDRDVLRKKEIELYEKIYINKAYYEQFRDSHYASFAPEFLTREQGVIRNLPTFLGYQEKQDRFVHYHAHNSQFLSDVISPAPEPFVNRDHFHRVLSGRLNALFAIEERDRPIEKLKQVLPKLLPLCRQLDSEHDLTLSDREHLKSLTHDSSFIPQAFNEMIQESIDDYLSNGLVVDERYRFLAEVKKIFIELKASHPSSGLQQKITVPAPLIRRDAAPSPRVRGEGKKEGGYLEALSDQSDQEHLGGQLAHNLLEPIKQGIFTAFQHRAEQLLLTSISIEENLSLSVDNIGEQLLNNFTEIAQELEKAQLPDLKGLLDFQISFIEQIQGNDWRDFSQFMQQQLEGGNGFTDKDSATLAHRPFIECIRESFERADDALQKMQEKDENIHEAVSLCQDLEAYFLMIQTSNDLAVTFGTEEEPFVLLEKNKLALLKNRHLLMIEKIAAYMVAHKILEQDRAAMLTDLSETSLNAVEQSIETLLNANSDNQKEFEAFEVLEALNEANLSSKQQLLEDNVENELICYHLAHDELRKLTSSYERHLRIAQRHIVGGSPFSLARRDSINKKMKMIHTLQDILSQVMSEPDIEHPRKNQTIVAEFYLKLDEFDQDIKKHRDGPWGRYVANVVKIAAIILTGILPGLLVLSILAKSRHSMKFWQSHGEQFYNEIKGYQSPKEVAAPTIAGL